MEFLFHFDGKINANLATESSKGPKLCRFQGNTSLQQRDFANLQNSQS